MFSTLRVGGNVRKQSKDDDANAGAGCMAQLLSSWTAGMRAPSSSPRTRVKTLLWCCKFAIPVLETKQEDARGLTDQPD